MRFRDREDRLTSMTSDTKPATTIRRLRRFAVIWTVLCVCAGVAGGLQVLQLRSAAGALEDTGGALVRTGETLDELSKLPLVGKQMERAARGASTEGARARAAGSRARSQLTITAWMVGLALSILPTVPLILVAWTLGDVGTRRRS